jgi:hypothetical protein
MEGVEHGPGAPANASTPAPAAALPPAAPLFQDAALDRLIKLASSGDVPQVVSDGLGAPAEGGHSLGEGLELASVRDWPEETGDDPPGMRHATHEEIPAQEHHACNPSFCTHRAISISHYRTVLGATRGGSF